MSRKKRRMRAQQILMSIIGVLIMIILVNLSLLANLPIQSQMLVKGIVVVGAVWINSKKIQVKAQT